MKKIYEVHEFSPEEGKTGIRIKVCASADAVIRLLTCNNSKRYTLTFMYDDIDMPLKAEMIYNGAKLKRKDNKAKNLNDESFLGVPFEKVSGSMTREEYDELNNMFKIDEYKYFIVFEQELYE